MKMTVTQMTCEWQFKSMGNEYYTFRTLENPEVQYGYMTQEKRHWAKPYARVSSEVKPVFVEVAYYLPPDLRCPQLAVDRLLKLKMLE